MGVELNPFKKASSILITGEIKWETIDDVWEAYMDLIMAPKLNPDQPLHLVVFVATQGGDRDAGISLMSLLRSFDVEITTVGFGKIYSSGIYPFLASKKRRYVLADTVFLFHPTTFELDHDININSLKENVESDAIDNREFRVVLEQLKVNEGVLDKLSEPTTSIFLTAQAAHHYGLATHIISKLSEVDIEVSSD